jgi:hypothetical protein
MVTNSTQLGGAHRIIDLTYKLTPEQIESLAGKNIRGLQITEEGPTGLIFETRNSKENGETTSICYWPDPQSTFDAKSQIEQFLEELRISGLVLTTNH